MEIYDELSPREVAAWLETPDGEEWSRGHHRPADHNETGVFGSVKGDDDLISVDYYYRYGPQVMLIRGDTERYGMNGLSLYARTEYSTPEIEEIEREMGNVSHHSDR